MTGFHSGQTRLEIPYLTRPVVVTAKGDLFCEFKRSAPPLVRVIARMLIVGGCRLDDVARLFEAAWNDDRTRTQDTVRKFLRSTGFADVAQLSLPESVDVVILDPGWHGVFQNAVDLWVSLNERCRALLIAPRNPLYGELGGPRDLAISCESIGLPGDNFVSFINLARSILLNLQYGVLLCSHRVVTPFLFDIAERAPMIIHGDGHFERYISLGETYSARFDQMELPEILQELYLGSASPLHSCYLMALYRSFARAAENWCWTPDQLRMLVEPFPERAQSAHLVMPMIEAKFAQAKYEQSADLPLLFTTTYGGREAEIKGLEPLTNLLEHDRDLTLRIVLADEASLPKSVARIEPQTEVLYGVTKAKMQEIYAHSLANCRISRADSSPVSVLESMACGVPNIVSPMIARNISAIRHGENAFVVEPDDREGLAEIVRRLRRHPDLRRKIGRAARDAVSRYSLDNNIDRLLKYVRGAAVVVS